RADHGDLVVDDQLLRQALGVVGHAGVVLDDQIDLLAADGRAVLVHVLLDAGLHLLADRGEPAGERQHQADLGVVLGNGATRRQCARGRCNGDGEISTQHRVSSWLHAVWLGGLGAIYTRKRSGSWLKKLILRVNATTARRSQE